MKFIFLFLTLLLVVNNKKIRKKSKWFSAGTHWGNSDRDPPGEVASPFANTGFDQNGLYINNNSWRHSDLNPQNQHNGWPLVVGNKSKTAHANKQPCPQKFDGHYRARERELSNAKNKFRIRQGDSEEAFHGTGAFMKHKEGSQYAASSGCGGANIGEGPCNGDTPGYESSMRKGRR